MPRAPSDPGDRSVEAYLASLNELHQRLDEGMSFSGNERNKVFLNCGARAANGAGHQDRGDPDRGDLDRGEQARFADASAVSGLDFADDARGLAFFDWDFDGDLDVALSNRTAPRLRLMRNESPPAGAFVSLRLEGNGVTTNRDAVGARVALATSLGESIHTVRAGEGFLSQSSLSVHFGLGRAKLLGTAIVRWPGGGDEVFSGLEAGQSYRLSQGKGVASRVEPPSGRLALTASSQAPAVATTGERVVLATRPPAPRLTLRPFDSEHDQAIDTGRGATVLLNVWASWCLPCRGELEELAQAAPGLRAAGLKVVAISTDGLGERPQTAAADARKFMEQIAFPFKNGLATPETLDKIDIIQRYLFDRQFPLALPFSLLIDGQGRLAVLYRGGVHPEGLLRDRDQLGENRSAPAELRESSVPMAGHWYTEPDAQPSVVAYARWFEERFPDEAIALLENDVERSNTRIRDLPVDSIERGRARLDLGEAFRRLAFVEARRKNPAAAARHYRSLLKLEPEDEAAQNRLLNALFEAGNHDELLAEVRARLDRSPADRELRVRLAEVLDREGKPEEAARELERAIGDHPEDAQLRYLLGHALARQQQSTAAVEQLEKAVALDPSYLEAQSLLGLVALAEHDFETATRHLLRAVEIDPRNGEARHGLARAYAEAGKIEEAVSQYRALVEIEPEGAAGHHELGLALLRARERAEGVDEIRRAYTLDRSFLPAANNVAWILATRPEKALRDAAAALRLAREINALTDHREPAFLETLAAALAESGDFEAAAQTVERAIEVVGGGGQEQQLELLRSRLRLYREGKTGR